MAVARVAAQAMACIALGTWISHAAGEADRKIANKIAFVRACVTEQAATQRAPVCNDAALRNALLNLSRNEIEVLLGPPQYHLRLGANDLHYWTIRIWSRGVARSVRVQVAFGECFSREKNSRVKAVCEVTTH